MTNEVISIMNVLGIGDVIAQMKQQIQQIKVELDEIGEPESIPEMIQSTNLLRVNEHLSKSNQKKSELLIAYDEYSKQLEYLVSSIFEIQDELKEILKEQSNLISSSKSNRVKSTSKKIKKKPRK